MRATFSGTKVVNAFYNLRAMQFAGVNESKHKNFRKIQSAVKIFIIFKIFNSWEKHFFCYLKSILKF